MTLNQATASKRVMGPPAEKPIDRPLTPARDVVDRAGDCLRHPLTLGMLVLWVVNDHVLKALLANAWTGKLSDVAGLAVFPLIPVAAYELTCAVRGRVPRFRRTILLVSMAATGTLLAGINLSEPLANAFRVGLGAAQWPFLCLWSVFFESAVPPLTPVYHTMDPTDLWTLPALAIPYWIARRPRRP